MRILRYTTLKRLSPAIISRTLTVAFIRGAIN